MKIDAVQLALLCASHFIIFFSDKDINGVRYHSDYDMMLEDRCLTLWCEVKFDAQKKRVVNFRFDADLKYEDGGVEIEGSIHHAARKAMGLINEYLAAGVQ